MVSVRPDIKEIERIQRELFDEMESAVEDENSSMPSSWVSHATFLLRDFVPMRSKLPLQRSLRPLQVVGSGGENLELSCSFCGRRGDEVKLGAGPSVYICKECVDTFSEYFKDEEKA
jgi:hypothetical protein